MNQASGAAEVGAAVDPQVAKTLGLGKSPRRRTAFIATALVLVAAAVLASGVVSRRRAARAIPGYETAVVTVGDMTVLVTATGTLEPANAVDVGAEISGRVAALHADFNQKVTRGQLLAELDTEGLNIAVDQAKAALALAQANVLQAQAAAAEATANAERADALFKRTALSKAEHDAATSAQARTQAGVASARAQVQNAQAALNATRTHLRKAAIRSPINGIVLARTVERGQTVMAALQTPVLFIIAEDLTKMTLHVNVDESDVGRVHADQKATFTVDAYPGRKFFAVIREVRHQPVMVQNVVTYDAVLTVENPELLLRPGMTATSTIQTDTRRDVLRVPNAALRFTPPQTAQEKAEAKRTTVRREDVVWTEEDGNLKRIPVTLGASDGTYTEVVGTALEEGDTVITDVKVPAQKTGR